MSVNASSKAQKAQRVAEVFEMIVQGKSTHTIIKQSVKKYEVAERTIYGYIAIATKDMRKMLESKKRAKLDKAIHQREFLIEKMMDAEQFAMASQTLDSKNKLERLFDEDSMPVEVILKIK